MKFPDTLELGDTIDVEYALPPRVDDREWTNAALTFQKLGDNFDYGLVGPTINNVYGKLDIDNDAGTLRVLFIPEPLAGVGVFNYRLYVKSGLYQKTIDTGFVEIVRGGDLDLSHDEKMVLILKRLLEEKLSGRGDVTYYQIGDRQLSTMNAVELKKLLNQYELNVAWKKKPRRSWRSYNLGG